MSKETCVCHKRRVYVKKVLQRISPKSVAVCCSCQASVLQCITACYSVLQCVDVCCSVMRCVAAFRVPLLRRKVRDGENTRDSHCVAACCSVLQRVAVCHSRFRTSVARNVL